MKLELSDEEVKDAIYSWLARHLTTVPPLAKVKIRRLYYNEGSGYETVIEFDEN